MAFVVCESGMKVDDGCCGCRFTYVPPKTEDRALLFDTEIRGQMAMLMGGRAAEELTCGQVTPLLTS